MRSAAPASPAMYSGFSYRMSMTAVPISIRLVFAPTAASSGKASRAGGRSDAPGSKPRPRRVPRRRRPSRSIARGRPTPIASATGAKASNGQMTGSRSFSWTRAGVLRSVLALLTRTDRVREVPIQSRHNARLSPAFLICFCEASLLRLRCLAPTAADCPRHRRSPVARKAGQRCR